MQGSPLGNPLRKSFARLAFSLAIAALAGAACSDAFAPGEETALDLEGCEALGGTPLFDPGDPRPLEQSCPEGLFFLGAFEDDFYGAEGGVCCADLQRFDEASAGTP